MRRASIFLAAAVLFGSSQLAFDAAPAGAHWSDCPVGYGCLWQPIDYAGAPDARFANSVMLGASNNRINSVVNNGRTNRARFYDYSNYTGPYFTLNNPARGGQWRDPYLSNGAGESTANWSNRISSARFI